MDDVKNLHRKLVVRKQTGGTKPSEPDTDFLKKYDFEKR